MIRILQFLFWAAALTALVMALLPLPPSLPGDPSDKLQHIAAFFTLGVLGALAYPQRPAWQLLVGLALFGALIELGQLIPALGRFGDPIDWLADLAAAALGLAVIALLRRFAARG